MSLKHSESNLLMELVIPHSWQSYMSVIKIFKSQWKNCDIFLPEMELQFRTKTDCLIRRGSKENKDDRVESIFAESHCETACPQGKHSNVGKFPFEKETFPMLDIISLRKKWVFLILEPGMLLGACKPGSQAHIDSRTERVKSLGKVRNEMKCVLSIIESYSIEKNGSRFSHLPPPPYIKCPFFWRVP